MKRSTIARLVMALGSAYFLVKSARLIASRGPIQFKAPATIVSNSHEGQRGLDPYLLFLADVRGRVPAAASVAVRGPNAEFAWGTVDYDIAVGQLPRNDVRQLSALDGSNPPQFVASFQNESDDDRYRLVAALPFGCLYEIRQ